MSATVSPETIASGHLNAARDLPDDLCRQLQDALGGRSAYVWIPSRRMQRAQARAERVVGLKRQGKSARDIAAEVGLSERRVFQIVAERRCR